MLQARGHISAVGSKIGMGKEADIYMAQTPDGEQVVLKFHRLGRTSFKAVKNKRDYLKSRTSVSWLYMSRLSALKEFAFMTALFQHGFPTPTPLDHNRYSSWAECFGLNVVEYVLSCVHQPCGVRSISPS